MSPSTPCPQCGASRKGADARTCDYCGTVLVAEPSARERREADLARDFEELRRSTEFARAIVASPSITGHLVGGGCVVVFLLVFVGVAGFMALSASSTIGGPVSLPFTIVPLMIGAVGVFMLFTVLGRARRMATSPLEREPAIVVSKRSTKSEDSSTHYVTLQFESGIREVSNVSGILYGQLATGDLGVAYRRGGILLDFRRLSLG